MTYTCGKEFGNDERILKAFEFYTSEELKVVNKEGFYAQ